VLTFGGQVAAADTVFAYVPFHFSFRTVGGLFDLRVRGLSAPGSAVAIVLRDGGAQLACVRRSA